MSWWELVGKGPYGTFIPQVRYGGALCGVTDDRWPMAWQARQAAGVFIRRVRVPMIAVWSYTLCILIFQSAGVQKLTVQVAAPGLAPLNAYYYCAPWLPKLVQLYTLSITRVRTPPDGMQVKALL